MKKLLMFIIATGLLQSVKADSHFIPDTSPIRSKQMVHDTVRVIHDTVIVLPLKPAVISYYKDNIYKQRLDSIKKDVPLDYNEYVQKYIDIYLGNERKTISYILGLSKYYFPIYEKAFKDAGIPEEIKYLSIIESKLNPNAVSRVGATGLWQFMPNTAKAYRLNMNAYVDERRDPIQSSYAAAAYLKEAYQQFGDWLLAIASYNCGKGNVTRAIKKAGANDFWSVRQYLPKATRGYVPAYIAITYVMNYYQKHNVVPKEYNFSIETDTVLVNKYISLNNVSKILSIDLLQLAILNPSYKRLIVNGTSAFPKRLVIPQAAKEKYVTLSNVFNTDVNHAVVHDNNILYTYGQSAEQESSNHHKTRNHSQKNRKSNYITYKVRRGDTLKVIANKFNRTSVAQIKELNGLKNSHLQPGMTLKINKI